MNYLSVCSGIEAATVAWHPLSYKPIAFSEIEKFPAQVLDHHYPNTPNWGDMTKFKEWPDACVCSAGIDGKQNGSGRTSGDGGVGRVNVHTKHGGSTFRCDYCERFFAHGECDCPKCQGFCACKQTKGTTCEKCGGAAINVLVGGTPCQSFSVAGLRKGLDDPRGNLMLTYLAIADKYRPRWMVWENVPGVLSSNGGLDFASFLRGLAELGYGFAYRILDAQYFGVAQRRRRVFVVGCLGGWQRAAAVLFERHSLQGHSAPRRKAGEVVAPTITRGVGSGGTAGQDEGMMAVAKCLNAHTGIDYPDRQNYLVWPADTAPTLDAHYGDKQGLENQHINGGGGLFVPVIKPTLKRQGDAKVNDEPIAFGWQNSSKQGASASASHTPTLDKSKVPAVVYVGGVDYENNGHTMDEPTGPLMKGSPTGGGRPLPAVAFTQDSQFGGCE